MDRRSRVLARVFTCCGIALLPGCAAALFHHVPSLVPCGDRALLVRPARSRCLGLAAASAAERASAPSRTVPSRHIPCRLAAEPASCPGFPAALAFQSLAELAIRLFVEIFRAIREIFRAIRKIFRVIRTFGLGAGTGHAGILPLSSSAFAALPAQSADSGQLYRPSWAPACTPLRRRVAHTVSTRAMTSRACKRYPAGPWEGR